VLCVEGPRIHKRCRCTHRNADAFARRRGVRACERIGKIVLQDAACICMLPLAEVVQGLCMRPLSGVASGLSISPLHVQGANNHHTSQSRQIARLWQEGSEISVVVLQVLGRAIAQVPVTNGTWHMRLPSSSPLRAAPVRTNTRMPLHLMHALQIAQFTL